MGLPLFLLFLHLGLLWETVRSQNCGLLQDSSHIISQCQPSLEAFQKADSPLGFAILLSREIKQQPNLFETPLPTCCEMLQFGSQDFSGRQCMCRLLQSSEDKQLLQLLNSVNDPKFLNAACGRSFEIVTSSDTCSTPTVINERLDQDTADGKCKHKLLELKNDVCRKSPKPPSALCCSNLAALAKDPNCVCNLSKRKIAGLTQQSVTFFDSLTSDDRFKKCGSSINSIRRIREGCLTKLDTLSSLPSATVIEGCGEMAQVAFEDTCAPAMKKDMAGKLPRSGGRPELDGSITLRELKSKIESLNSKNPAQAKAVIERVKNNTHELFDIVDNFDDHQLTSHTEGVESLFEASSSFASIRSDYPVFLTDVDSFFQASPVEEEDVNSFLQRLGKFLEDHPPPVVPDTFPCCQSLDKLADFKCACLLKRRDASLKLKNRTLEFVDSIRPRGSGVSGHCDVELDSVTGVNPHICASILNPRPVLPSFTQKECWQILSGAVQCREVLVQPLI